MQKHRCKSQNFVWPPKKEKELSFWIISSSIWQLHKNTQHLIQFSFQHISGGGLNVTKKWYINIKWQLLLNNTLDHSAFEETTSDMSVYNLLVFPPLFFTFFMQFDYIWLTKMAAGVPNCQLHWWVSKAEDFTFSCKGKKENEKISNNQKLQTPPTKWMEFWYEGILQKVRHIIFLLIHLNFLFLYPFFLSQEKLNEMLTYLYLFYLVNHAKTT